VPGLRLESSSPYAAIPCKKLRGVEVYFIGPGAGGFFRGTSPAALLAPVEQARGLRQGKLSGVFDIAENVVSIFAVGPISEGTARWLARSTSLRDAAQGPLEQAPPATLEFALSGDEGQRLSLRLVYEAPLASVLSKLDKDQKQQLVLFRLLWHMSAASAGCVRAPDLPRTPIEAQLSTTTDEDGELQLNLLLRTCRVGNDKELLGRLTSDIVLQQLLRGLLAPNGNQRQSPNVCVAILVWSTTSREALDVAASFIYIRPL
jgi:hypothetical protein